MALATIRRMTDHDKKRGKVSDEHRAEAAALKAIWESTKEARGAAGHASQEAFGEKFEIGNQAAVGFFLNGKTALSPKAAAAFARGLGCKVEDFSPRLAKMLATPDAGSGWPFPDIEAGRFAALATGAKFEIQGLVRERIEAFEGGKVIKALDIHPATLPAEIVAIWSHLTPKNRRLWEKAGRGLLPIDAPIKL